MLSKSFLSSACLLGALSVPVLSLPSFKENTARELNARQSTYPAPIALAGNTSVIRDPTLCKDPSSGEYYLFTTGDLIEIRKSVDLVTWNWVGVVWPDGANWGDAYNDASGTFWAPDCTIDDGVWKLYYAASTSGSQNSAIFYATSSTGQPGSWTNEGLVNSSSSANNYNAIDPNLIISGDEYYLSLGSYWTGIKGANISESTGLFTTSEPILDNLAERALGGPTNEEGSVIIKYGDYFYMFVSWGYDTTYDVRIGRSEHLTYGYVDEDGVALIEGGGTEILASHDSVTGPGGMDVFEDDDGTVYMVYHYLNASSIDTLGINILDFSSGWPVVVSGNPTVSSNSSSRTSTTSSASSTSTSASSSSSSSASASSTATTSSATVLVSSIAATTAYVTTTSFTTGYSTSTLTLLSTSTGGTSSGTSGQQCKRKL